VECFVIQLGVSLALARGCSKLVVISDSKPALETLLDVSVHSGQIFSLDSCRVLHPWLAEDGEHSIALWHAPARFEWKVQKAAHDSVVHIRIAAGPRPRTSRDFLAACSNVQAIKDWHAEFRKPSYRGANFMDLSVQGQAHLPLDLQRWALVTRGRTGTICLHSALQERYGTCPGWGVSPQISHRGP
jgi:hypothetical protein